jgi:hypothetical protein
MACYELEPVTLENALELVLLAAEVDDPVVAAVRSPLARVSSRRRREIGSAIRHRVAATPFAQQGEEPAR